MILLKMDLIFIFNYGPTINLSIKTSQIQITGLVRKKGEKASSNFRGTNPQLAGRGPHP